MLKIKLFAAFGFLAIVACVLLFPGERSRAQTSRENAKKRDEVLEKVADYKAWKQVLKPEKPIDETDESKIQPVISTTLAA